MNDTYSSTSTSTFSRTARVPPSGPPCPIEGFSSSSTRWRRPEIPLHLVLNRDSKEQNVKQARARLRARRCDVTFCLVATLRGV